VDKKSLIGLGIIAAILGLWMYISGPTKETIARNKQIKDSIALVQQKADADLRAKDAMVKTVVDTLKASVVLSDSAKTALQNDKYRDFTPATIGKEETFIIENDNIKATILNKGAQIIKVELKKYHRSGKTEPLVLFDRDSLKFALQLNLYDRSRTFFTDEFYFRSAKQTPTGIDLKLETSKPGSYIEISYSLNSTDYLVNSEIRFVGMEKIISQTEDQLQLSWSMLFPTQEKHIVKEKKSATIYYKQAINSPDYINPMKDADEIKELNDVDIKWVSFKQQYFNSTIIAEKEFAKAGSFVKTSPRKDSKEIVKAAATELGIPYAHLPNEKFAFKFYFGPNDYKFLKECGNEMEHIVPTGWSIFSYINKWMVIPLFDSLGFMNMGIVILILTLIVKIVLLPIAYKTYMSGARMRVLKPETDALTAKFEKNPDPMKKQQEQMALYRKAGVNPLSGCFPLLLQFPILIALFAFLPAAIELRQANFLWAEDLSTYDTVWNFGYVPFVNWAYGDHVSLFALLMFVSTLVYTYMNSSMMPQQNNQMPGMKFMMYFMPVIFLAVMNDYAAGLSWYYFLANMFTFLQNWIMKKIISDSKIREQLEANMKKPVKVSNFQKRLADMSKERAQIGKKK
jgi:YidC/Oxa1 family membrane protein insertase